MSRLYPVLAGAVAFALSMNLAAETPAPLTSGIEGTIMVSPNRPGPVRADRPSVSAVPNTQFAVKSGDATVATFTTDGEGRFKVSVPAGHYLVMREGAGSRIGRWQFEVDVVAGQVAKVNWKADSGMR